MVEEEQPINSLYLMKTCEVFDYCNNLVEG